MTTLPRERKKKCDEEVQNNKKNLAFLKIYDRPFCRGQILLSAPRQQGYCIQG